MLYDTMFNMAQDAAMRQQQNGGFAPDDTICVLCSSSGRFYTGFSHVELFNGNPVGVHAEVAAMQQMMAAGEFIASSLLLVSAFNLSAMLPCGGCAQFIMSQNPANAGCQIILPDRVMLLSELGAPQGGMPPMQPQPAAPAPAAGAAGMHSSSDLLKSRVGNLLNVDDDDDDDEKEDEKKSLFGRLFGKK